MQNKNKIYKTDSYYLSCYLLAAGCELSGLEPLFSGSEKFIFCFFETDNLHFLVKDYYSLQATVRPQDFANAQKTLKSIIYSKKKGSNNG